MIFNYVDFISENYKQKNGSNTFFVLVAIAVFNQDILDFTDTVRNRYTMSDSEVNQLLLLRLNEEKRIVFKDNGNKPTVLVNNLNNSWNLLRKAKKASFDILKEFKNPNRIFITADDIEIEDNNSITLIKRNTKSKINSKTYAYDLGIDDKEIYKSSLWEELINRWVTLLKSSINPEYSNYIDELSNYKNLSWYDFMSRPKQSLGIKISSLNRLYYNNMLDFSKDVTYDKTLFTNYNKFIKEWLSIKKEIFLNKIIIPLVKGKLEALNNSEGLLLLFNEITKNNNTNNTHYSLNNQGLLVKSNSRKTPADIVNYNLLVNKKSDLIIELKSETSKIKFLVGTSLIFPSHIKIKSKQDG